MNSLHADLGKIYLFGMLVRKTADEVLSMEVIIPVTNPEGEFPGTLLGVHNIRCVLF